MVCAAFLFLIKDTVRSTTCHFNIFRCSSRYVFAHRSPRSAKLPQQVSSLSFASSPSTLILPLWQQFASLYIQPVTEQSRIVIFSPFLPHEKGDSPSYFYHFFRNDLTVLYYSLSLCLIYALKQRLQVFFLWQYLVFMTIFILYPRHPSPSHLLHCW